ncbi:hypothetical protein [Streptomyces violascens]|uniref:hypothetical protein n=1 Tax=Streptomyces violascens TaxID=67381 RepID=UPI0036534726
MTNTTPTPSPGTGPTAAAVGSHRCCSFGGSSAQRRTASTQSIYAPCGDGQLAALRRAYQDADCSPRSVELIDTPGTKAVKEAAPNT